MGKVWICTGTHTDAKTFHTERCQYVRDGQRVQRVSKDTAKRMGRDECRYCADDIDWKYGEEWHKINRRLKAND